MVLILVPSGNNPIAPLLFNTSKAWFFATPSWASLSTDIHPTALKKGYKDTPQLRNELLELCKKNLAVYSIPKEFEFRQSLPKTMLGKVDFRKLQEENMKKRAEEKNGK